MDAKRQARLAARAEIIKALAHATRLLIVEELTDGERCVCELTDMVDADMSTVSKHLATLRGAGIVTSDKRGNQIFYALQCPCILDFLGCIEGVIKTRLKAERATL